MPSGDYRDGPVIVIAEDIVAVGLRLGGFTFTVDFAFDRGQVLFTKVVPSPLISNISYAMTNGVKSPTLSP